MSQTLPSVICIPISVSAELCSEYPRPHKRFRAYWLPWHLPCVLFLLIPSQPMMSPPSLSTHLCRWQTCRDSPLTQDRDRSKSPLEILRVWEDFFLKLDWISEVIFLLPPTWKWGFWIKQFKETSWRFSFAGSSLEGWVACAWLNALEPSYFSLLLKSKTILIHFVKFGD